MVFITDRTEQDVLLGNEKGQYTATDLNRVESNVQELVKIAKKLDILLTLTTKTDWNRKDQWMNETQALRYIQNINNLLSAFKLTATLPQSMDKLDVYSANDIEKALQMVYNRITAVTDAFKYSGEFFAGEEYL